jgi:outer membrane protein assembly factor BamB
MSGCAALLNSDRPAYHGPIARAAWHNSSVQAEQTPYLHGGVAYVIARPFADRDFPRVFAFDLRTGSSLWSAGFQAKEILLAAGSQLFVSEIGGRLHSLDLKTGAEAALPPTVSMAKAAFAGGVLYTASGAVVKALKLASFPQSAPIWEMFTPLTEPSTPVVAGGNVYVYGRSPGDYVKARDGLAGVYAFDARTGTLRWKWESEDKTDSFFCDGLAADGDAAYVWTVDKRKSVFGTGTLMAFDAATGQEKWRHTTSMYAPFSAAPILFAPRLVVIPNYPTGEQRTANDTGFIYRALDRATGAKVWESQTPWKYELSVVFDELLLVSDKQAHEVLNENNNVTPDSWVSTVSLRTGKELWRSETIELAVLTAPAAGEGMAVVGSKPFVWADPPRSGKKDVAGLWAWTLAR